MDWDAPHCSSSDLGSSQTHELSRHPRGSSQNYTVQPRHRRHASNVSAAAATRLRPPAVTRRSHDHCETSPHGSALAPLHEAPSQTKPHMKRISGISKTFSFPNLHSPQPDTENRPSSSPGAQPPSTPLLRANTSPSIPRLSPSQTRKAPASHSSYGIETSNGPPPSYSTRQTLSQDRGWTQERGRPPKAGAASPNTGSYKAYTQGAGSKDAKGSDSGSLHVTYKNKNANSVTPSTPTTNHFSNNLDDTYFASQNHATCTNTLSDSTSASRR